MDSLWPWLVIAGLGALHGLNPTSGWLFAAAWGVRSRSRAQALWAVLPIAAGHALSVAMVGAAVVWGLAMDRVVLQAVAVGLFAAMAVVHLSGRAPRLVRAPAGHAGLVLWSFAMSTAHGAGLMLVPALMPLCFGDAQVAATVSNSLALPLLAVAIHTAAMLIVTGAAAAGAFRGWEAGGRWLRVTRCKP